MKKSIRSDKKFINRKEYVPLFEKTGTIIVVAIVAVGGGLVMFKLGDSPQNKDMHEVLNVWGILLFELAFFAIYGLCGDGYDPFD